MIAFSKLSADSAIGRVARLSLRCVPRSAVFTILQGPGRGLRWVVGSSNHGCWLGSYEIDKQNYFRHCVKPGMICYDIGANAGFYTLLLSKLVGPAGHVFAFEPVPENCLALKRHLALNEIRNVTLIECAVGDSDGTAGFELGALNSLGRLNSGGGLEVQIRTLDSLISMRRIVPPDVMKIDVEGAEAQVLRGARRLLASASPIISVATHGAAAHSECIDLLRANGFTVDGMGGRAIELTDELCATRLCAAIT